MELKLLAFLLFELLALFAGIYAAVSDSRKSITKEHVNNNVVDFHTDLKCKHHEAERNLKDVLIRLEQIEARERAREKMYQHDLDNLRRQLYIQTKRTTSLQRLVKQLYKENPQNLEEQRDKKFYTFNGTDIHAKNAAIQSHKVFKTQRIRRAENETPVAFFATLSQHLNHLSAQQPITFDNIITNIGSAYNSHFGSFIAPVPGTYVFSTTLFSHYHTNYHGNFVKNGQIITRMYVSGGEAGYDTTSQTVILELVKGDDVCIQNTDADKPVYGFNYSTFSGFLLQENFSSSVIVG